MRGVALALVAAVAACTAGLPLRRRRSRSAARRCSCATTRRCGTTRTAGSTRTAPSWRRGQLSRASEALISNDCLTRSADLDGLPALYARLQPFLIENGGPAIRPVPVHLGIVTGISDEALVTRYFRGLGYRSRGIGAEGLGRRIYIGPFTTQGAADQALAVAREAGFIAPVAWSRRLTTDGF